MFTVRKRCNSSTINRMRRGGRIRYWLFIIVYYPSIQDLFDFDQKRNRDIVCSSFDAALKVFALSDISVHDNPLRLNLRNSTRKACMVNPCVSSRWTALVDVQVNKQSNRQSSINRQSCFSIFFSRQIYKGLAKLSPVIVNGGSISGGSSWFRQLTHFLQFTSFQKYQFSVYGSRSKVTFGFACYNIPIIIWSNQNIYRVVTFFSKVMSQIQGVDMRVLGYINLE